MSTTREQYLYQKRWKLDRARGLKRLTDSTAARIHVESLLMAGASVRSIAAAAGVSATTVCGIANGRGKQIKVTVSTAVLAVTLDDTLDRRRSGRDFVVKVGAVRRIQALMALGHRAQDIADAGDMRKCGVYNTVNQHGRWVSHDRHTSIKAAYEALSMRPGPSSLVRARSLAKGWLPPLAWDEDDIDDPNAYPVEVDPPKSIRTEEVVEDVEFLLASGTAPAVIPTRLGYKNAEALSRTLHRIGRPDLARRIESRENAA